LLVSIVPQLVVIPEELRPQPVNLLPLAGGVVVVHHLDPCNRKPPSPLYFKTPSPLSNMNMNTLQQTITIITLQHYTTLVTLQQNPSITTLQYNTTFISYPNCNITTMEHNITIT